MVASASFRAMSSRFGSIQYGRFYVGLQHWNHWSTPICRFFDLSDASFQHSLKLYLHLLFRLMGTICTAVTLYHCMVLHFVSAKLALGWSSTVLWSPKCHTWFHPIIWGNPSTELPWYWGCYCPIRSPPQLCKTWTVLLWWLSFHKTCPLVPVFLLERRVVYVS